MVNPMVMHLIETHIITKIIIRIIGLGLKITHMIPKKTNEYNLKVTL